MKVIVIVLGMLLSVNAFPYVIFHGSDGLFYVYCKGSSHSAGTTSTYEEAQALGNGCNESIADIDDDIDKYEIRLRR